MPPVEYNPEPLPALRARYAKALEFVYDCAAVRDAGAIRPGEVAANCFDHADGLRLIVSRDRYPDGVVRLHVSASFQTGSRMFVSLQREAANLTGVAGVADLARRWAAGIPERFRQLAGTGAPALRFIGWSDGKLIPHWLADE